MGVHKGKVSTPSTPVLRLRVEPLVQSDVSGSTVIDTKRWEENEGKRPPSIQFRFLRGSGLAREPERRVDAGTLGILVRNYVDTAEGPGPRRGLPQADRLACGLVFQGGRLPRRRGLRGGAHSPPVMDALCAGPRTGTETPFVGGGDVGCTARSKTGSESCDAPTFGALKCVLLATWTGRNPLRETRAPP